MSERKSEMCCKIQYIKTIRSLLDTENEAITIFTLLNITHTQLIISTTQNENPYLTSDLIFEIYIKMIFYCLISPKIPAKLFRRFCIVSSPPTAAGSSSPFSSTLFFPGSASFFTALVATAAPERSFFTTSTFFTVELALLTSDTVLAASDAVNGEGKLVKQVFPISA